MVKGVMPTRVHYDCIGERYLVEIEAKGLLNSLTRFENYLRDNFGGITRQEIYQDETSELIGVSWTLYVEPQRANEVLHTLTSLSKETLTPQNITELLYQQIIARTLR